MSFSRACELLPSKAKQDIEKAKKIITNDSLYNITDTSENTLLHYASKIGNHEIVQFLTELGSKVDARNSLDETPLVSTLDTYNPCKEVIEILLKAGAKIMELHHLKSAVRIVNSTEWLNEDANKFQIYKMILDKADDFDYFDILETGNEKIIKMMLQANIDLSARDREGITIVHILAQNSNPGVMAALRGKNIDINVRDNDGWTPLMHAALYGASSSVKFLLEEGADIEAADDEKKTALYIAYEEFVDGEDMECIQLLLEGGANAQIVVDCDECATIFDEILESESFSVGELVLAHLSLQEAKEDNITQLIYSKIDSHGRLKTYFQECKQQLTTKIYRSVTLFDVLTASERKLERYLCDKELASKLLILQTVGYFDTILRKRLPIITSLIDLKKMAAPIVSELMKIDYGSYPSIMDEIVSYLVEKDLECLILILK